MHGRGLSRLPITLRVTLVFATVMALVLAATGLFLHLRLGAELDRAVADGLRSRADDLASVVHHSGPGSRPSAERLTEPGESFAEILDLRGAIVGGSPELGALALLDGSELARAARGTLLIPRRHVPALDEDPLRLLATPVDSPAGRLVVLVGVSIGDRDEALRDLAAELLVGGPVVLLLATLTAFGVARAALAPVESMRREAAAISGTETGRRLPVPSTRDELFRLGETLNAMLARLEAALAHERSFVADASHELRTPLATLRAELDVARRGARTRAELEDALRSAAEETEGLVRITEDLLVLARSEQRRLPLCLERSDVADILAAVRGRSAARAEAAGRRLGADAPAGLTVLADRLRLEQALGNLVDNALRHGGGDVSLVAAGGDEHAELHVLDEGTGFASAFIERAFDRFSRADEAHGDGGTGLGLAVVQGIARAHGGIARAANRLTGGADVWIELPDPSGLSLPSGRGGAGAADGGRGAPFEHRRRSAGTAPAARTG